MEDGCICLPCLQCVRTKQVAVVEDLGNFEQLLGKQRSRFAGLARFRGVLICSGLLQPATQLPGPGLHFVFWPLKSIVGRLSLRIQQLDVLCETKTKDNVFVHVSEIIWMANMLDLDLM